jgi:hypothetical protein
MYGVALPMFSIRIYKMERKFQNGLLGLAVVNFSVFHRHIRQLSVSF